MDEQTDPSKREQKLLVQRRCLLIIIVALMTTCIMGVVLVRNAENPMGQVIDTIVLDPEPSTILHLAGKVSYKNGKPAAHEILELHSEPRRTKSDSNGGFLFSDVETGEHTISILAEDGEVKQQRQMKIIRDKDSDSVTIALMENGEYSIKLANDVRILEMEVQLDTDELKINPIVYSYAKTDGTVVTKTGTANVKDGAIVSPLGNVYLPDGSIVFPGANLKDTTRIIKSDDTVIENKAVVIDDIKVSADGVVTLEDGTVIEPGGKIIQVNGEETLPSDSGNSIQDGVVSPIIPEKPITPNSENSQDPTDVPTQPDSSKNPEKPVVPDEGKLNLETQNKNGSYQEWIQSSSIDLFYHRTTGEKIAPGSTGYYLFRLQNSRQSDLNIIIEMEESSALHLPLKFTLTPLDAKGNKIKNQSITGSFIEGETIKLKTTVTSKSAVTYRLDWEWPFHDNDTTDTQIGIGSNKTYMIAMVIHAEE